MKKIEAEDKTVEAIATLIAAAIVDAIRIRVLQKTLTKLTGREFSYKDAYALSFLARGLGTWFEQGREHAQTIKEKTTV